jgi:hypothetical protein
MRLVTLSLLLVLSGCKSNPYCLNCEPGTDGSQVVLDFAGTEVDMTPEPDLLPPEDLTSVNDGGPCQVTNAGIEKCDKLDNDCNGLVDDIVPGSSLDPNNCGTCGNVCNFSAIHMLNKCEAGDMGAAMCVPTVCMPGFIDANLNLADGCEYQCTPTTPSTEVCDGKDNDCNGKIDDPFTLTYNGTAPVYDKDVTHCGSCAGVCNLPGAVNVCKTGGVCGVDHCINNGTDTFRHNPANPMPRDVTGCEVHCPFPSTTVTTGSQDCDSMSCTFPAELCNGIDDDCDFTADEAPLAASEGIPGTCTSSCPGGVCRGRCTPGTLCCTQGVKICTPGVGPIAETCNGMDDNCDGTVDEPFTLPAPQGFNGGNLQQPLYNKDPNRCGTCGTVCNLANAVQGCQSPAANTPGQCVVVSCTPGFYYAANTACGTPQTLPKNGPTGVGCFYRCERTGPTDLITTPSPEICDSRDNDCNGCVNDGLTPPAGLCSNQGFCFGKNIQPACQGASGWKCQYQAAMVPELDGSGNLRTTELLCDGVDGNCNGVTDLDGFPQLTQGCSVGSGICARNGTLKCVPMMPMAAPNCRDNTLPVSQPVTANNALAKAEECNDLDDDCDGLVDEATNGPTFNGYHDPMVQVGSQFVYRYEASRPDASGASPGGNSKRACSKPGVIPWNNVTQTQAAAACAAVRDSANNPMFLCSAPQWQTACEGPAPIPGPSPSVNLFSMSLTRDVYATGICNDANSGLSPLQVRVTAGGPSSGKQCFTPWAAGGLHDMSGNLAEWTATSFTSGTPAKTYFKTRGGSYTSPSNGTPPDGTSCEFDFAAFEATFANADIGFRCCSTAAP